MKPQITQTNNRFACIFTRLQRSCGMKPQITGFGLIERAALALGLQRSCGMKPQITSKMRPAHRATLCFKGAAA